MICYYYHIYQFVKLVINSIIKTITIFSYHSYIVGENTDSISSFYHISNKLRKINIHR